MEKQTPQPQNIDIQTELDAINSSITQSNKKNKTLITFMSLISLALVAVVVFLAYKNYQLQNKTLPLGEITFPDQNPPNGIPETPISPMPSKTTPKASELVAVDATWNRYINYKFGFSMDIPKESVFFYGACTKEPDSYRPKEAAVPVKVFDGENNFYIEPEYYYQLGLTASQDYKNTYAECNKVVNSAEKIAANLKDTDKSHYRQGWRITAQTVNSDQELEQFIKDIYGTGCKLGEKKMSQLAGIYDVSIDAGEFDDMDEALANGCLINYMYTIKYSPAKKTAVTWQQGQAVSFSDADYTAFDSTMTSSFKFLE